MTAHRSRPRPFRALVGGGLVAAAALAALSVHVAAENRGRSRALADALFHEDARTALWQMEMRVATMLGAISYDEPSTPGGGGGTPAMLACNIDPLGNRVGEPEPQSMEVASNVRFCADTAFLGAQPLERVATGTPAPGASWTQSISERGARRSADDYNRRADSNMMQQAQVLGGATTRVTVGPLATFWSDEGGELALYLTRRIDRGDATRYEAFFVEWRRLEEALMGALSGLFDRARVVPIREGSADPGDAMRLAGVPVRLEVERPTYAASVSRSYLVPLAGAWAGLLAALAAGWLGLRRSIAYGDKHRRFTQAVTHELRTPLTTFRMYSEMLRLGMVPPESRDEYLRALEQESERLVALVDNVLRYARLEEGQGPPPRRVVSVGELCDGAERAAAPAAARLGAQLVVEAPEAVRGRTLATDPDAVGQVLCNLLDNAFKYGGRPGAPARVTLRALLNAGQVELEVEDDGPGVEAAQRSRVFEPFDRAGRDSADPAPGVGLGLALARRLSEQLGARLELRDGDGGACFRLTLPAA